MASNGTNNYSQYFAVSKKEKGMIVVRIQDSSWLPEDICRFIQLAVNEYESCQLEDFQTYSLES